MDQTTLTSAHNGNQDAITATCEAFSKLATRIAKTQRISNWLDHEDVAQTATQKFWQRYLTGKAEEPLTPEHFKRIAYRITSAMAKQATRHDCAAKRDGRRTAHANAEGDSFEQHQAATANPAATAEVRDEVRSLTERMPEYEELFRALMDGMSYQDIDAAKGQRGAAWGKLKRARKKAREFAKASA